MIWDVCVQDLPIDARTIEDIPGDFVPSSIGRISEIIMKILEIAPFYEKISKYSQHIERLNYSTE